MINFLYNVSFYFMLIGFGGLAILSPSWKAKAIGILLWFVNFLIFKK